MDPTKEFAPLPPRSASPVKRIPAPVVAVDWAAREGAADAKKAEAEAVLTADLRVEIDRRAKLAAKEQEAAKIAKEIRDNEIARWIDYHVAELGDGAHVAPISFEDRDEFFVVRPDNKAHAKWEHGIASIQGGNKKLQREEVNIEYAVALVINWNGITDFAAGNLNGAQLIEFFKRNYPMTTPIINEGAKLAGYLAEDRKR